MTNATPCKRRPAGTSKSVLIADHKAKMMGKFFRNQDRNNLIGWVRPQYWKGVL